MSGRCKACNKILTANELFSRTIVAGDKEIVVEEELCISCRTALYIDSEDPTLDPVSLGVDIEV